MYELVGQQTSLNKKFYQGFSSDIKPILLKEHNDSRLLEFDTGKEYVWNNDKWVLKPQESFGITKHFDSGFGEQIVGDVNMAFVSNFAYQSDTRKLQTTLANGGTVTNPNSMLKVSSGINANGSAIGRSRRSLPYKAGQEAFSFFTAMWDSPVINNKRFIGLFDNLNGFAIGYNGLDFGVLRRKNSVDTEFIKQSDFNIVKIDGSVSQEDRQNAVDRFQKGTANIFLGSIRACSEAITLTASNHVIFAEIDWTPGKNIQAEDRAYRIGQKNTVNITYLVYENSVDEYILNTNITKEEVINKALE